MFSFVKNELLSNMTERRLNSYCIESQEDGIARKLSYDRTVLTKGNRNKSILQFLYVFQ